MNRLPSSHMPVSRSSISNAHLIQVMLIIGSVIASGFALYRIYSHTYAERGWDVEVTVACAAWIAMYVAATGIRFSTGYLFSSFYVVVLVLFHLSMTIFSAIGLAPEWAPGISEHWIELSGWYVILSLGCFGVGFALSLRSEHSTVTQSARDRITQTTLARAFHDGTGLLIVSLAFMFLTVATVGNLLSYSRADLFRGIGDTRGLGVFLMTFPSALVLLVLGATRRMQKWFAAIVASAGFGLLMLSGYRTSALYPLIVGAIIWRKTGRSIPPLLAVSALSVVVLAISFVGVLRQSGTYDSIDRRAIDSALEQTTPTDTIRLGQTGDLLAHVLRLVPSQDSYRYGVTYLDGLMESVPNISSGIRESKRLEAKREGLKGAGAYEQLPPSDWLTYRIARWAFDIGQGVGFTTIGEAYLNFGLVGVVGFFAVIGFFLGRLDQLDLGLYPGWLLFCSAFLWHLMRTVRDDFANFTKPAVFTLIILVSWRVFARVLRPRPA